MGGCFSRCGGIRARTARCMVRPQYEPRRCRWRSKVKPKNSITANTCVANGQGCPRGGRKAEGDGAVVLRMRPAPESPSGSWSAWGAATASASAATGRPELCSPRSAPYAGDEGRRTPPSTSSTCWSSRGDLRAEAQGLPYALLPRILSRREWLERCQRPGRRPSFTRA